MQAVREHGTHEVRMAAHLPLGTGQELVHIGIAARPQQVMAPGPVCINAVVDAVANDRRHRAQVRQTGPEAVKHAHVRTLQLLGTGCSEALAWVVQMPEIYVANLRPRYGHNAADVSGRDGPRFARPDRHHQLLDQRPSGDLVAKTPIEPCIHAER
jgi:hypothetical protein